MRIKEVRNGIMFYIVDEDGFILKVLMNKVDAMKEMKRIEAMGFDEEED